MERARLVDTALGRVEADLVLRDGLLINVFTCEVLEHIDVAVKGRRIAFVGKLGGDVGSARVVDVGGSYLTPGLIDAHVHIESSMLTVTNFAKAVLPYGTTSVMVDPHEIANVLGLKGVRLMAREAEHLPLKVFIQIPSCVPSAPNLETVGAEVGLDDVRVGLRWRGVVGLGEVMNYLGVLANEAKIVNEIKEAIKARKVVEGHCPKLGGRGLNAYVAAGVESDHESSGGFEGLEKLRLGLALEIREGSVMRNLKELISFILKAGIDTRRCLLATDDRHPEDLVKEGHMNFVLRRAIEEGVDPVEALQMASLNIAEHFNIDKDVGSVAPGRVADILVVKDLYRFDVEMVVADGAIVASGGKLLISLKAFKYPAYAKRTINLKRLLKPDDFNILAPIHKGFAEANIIHLTGDGGKRRVVEDVEVMDGRALVDVRRDLLKIAVVERYGKTGNIGKGFVKGFGIKHGALASSVAHDSHNIITVGASDEEMASAVNQVAKMQGGLVVVKEGRVMASLKLPIAGLLSEDGVEAVAEKHEKLVEASRSLGSKLKSPFMNLSMLALPVIPEISITDIGLIDVTQFKPLKLWVK